MTPILAPLLAVHPKLKPYPDGTKRKRYGAYPAGTLEKFRVFMGVHITDPVLHVCAGWVRYYPYARAVGPNDRTLDLDPSVEPYFLQDAREPWPKGFKAVIADPDYSVGDAAERPMGPGSLPKPLQLLARAYEALEPGRRFGIFHTKTVSIKEGQWICVALCPVTVGGNTRQRVFSVFERV